MKIIDLPSIGAVRFHKNTRATRIRLAVKPDQTVRVTVPWFCTISRARSFVVSQEKWIKAQLEK